MPDDEVEPLGGLGGLSGAAFFRFSSRGQTLLLKALPALGWEVKQLCRIQNALRFAESCGVDFLPVPLNTVDGHACIPTSQHLWELTPWLAGAAVLDRQLSQEELDAGVRAVARLHTTWANDGIEPSRVGRMASLRRRVAAWRRASSADWIRSPESLNEPSILKPGSTRRIAQLVGPLLPAVGELLREVEGEAYPQQTIIGDARREHLLFTGDRVTGLVDFGAMTLDSPMVDLARLLGEVADEETLVWKEAIEYYRSERPTSNAELRLLPVLDLSGVVLSAFNWLGWLSVERRNFDDPIAVATRMEYLTRRLEALACGKFAAQKAVISLAS